MDPFFIVFLITCGFAALTDFLIYKIPNEVIVFLFVLFFIKVFVLIGFEWDALKIPLIVFGATLFVCFVLYAVKLLGAGDAKIIAVVSLWMTDYNVLLFFILMTLAGGLMGLIYLKGHNFIEIGRLFLLKKISEVKVFKGYLDEKQFSPSRDIESKLKMTIPYGVAVFAGVILMLKFY